MEDDLLLFMDKVLINDEKDKITIIIDIKEMIEESHDVTIKVKYDNELLKEEKFVKKGEKDEED